MPRARVIELGQDDVLGGKIIVVHEDLGKVRMTFVPEIAVVADFDGAS